MRSKARSVETLKAEVADLKAEHRTYFVEKAERGYRVAEAQLDKLLATFAETQQTLRGAWSQWSELDVRCSTDDLDHIRVRLEAVRRECCWPGRSEAAYCRRSAAQ